MQYGALYINYNDNCQCMEVVEMEMLRSKVVLLSEVKCSS